MSHKRKGQLVRPPEWHVHLRRFLKRLFWKRERKAARAVCRDH